MATNLAGKFDAIKAEWQAGPRHPAVAASPPPVFVTIAREAGAGGRALAHQLADRLTAMEPMSAPWRAFDRELVEKVAADHDLSTTLIETLEQTSQNWLRYLLDSVIYPDDPGEIEVFRRVAATIRALGKAGRNIIVGRGGVFITSGLPGGVHVNLVAPKPTRIERLAQELEIPKAQATSNLNRIDAARQDFYRRHFPNQTLNPEAFTITLNTALIDEPGMVEVLTPLITNREGRTRSRIQHDLARAR
ncbi:MAG: hypothetical protein CMJ18_23365 [Phycisphaeraceae bacterium]|nr:hypothetical protein [Phycisphaeraceae bacterium]